MILLAQFPGFRQCSGGDQLFFPLIEPLQNFIAQSQQVGVIWHSFQAAFNGIQAVFHLILRQLLPGQSELLPGVLLQLNLALQC